jgi:predicted metalloprotease
MDIEGRRRSTRYEDRGTGGGGGGGLPIQALVSLAQVVGVKGMAVIAALLGVGYFFLPSSIKQQLLQALSGETRSSGQGARGAGSTCKASPTNAKACDFSLAVLASTEEVWTSAFQGGMLPEYERKPGAYELPTLVFFENGVSTNGCGNASSAVGPFYCPRDKRLYIDPGFYQVMEKRLKAPGDFAQAYVIAHEIGHHVQNLIGASDIQVRGETKNQVSVRVELQADCLAGVWGHAARASLAVTDEDLQEALNAAHAIGDDTLGHARESDYTHGTSEQRMRWFRRGFAGGDPRQCDTFRVANGGQL